MKYILEPLSGSFRAFGCAGIRLPASGIDKYKGEEDRLLDAGYNAIIMWTSPFLLLLLLHQLPASASRKKMNKNLLLLYHHHPF